MEGCEKLCGISGAVGQLYKEFCDISIKTMHHRGPNGQGSVVLDDPKVSLNHTRLSIIDLSEHGHEPIVDASGNYILVFNGEVYNYRELRRELEALGVIFSSQSDAEVVLYACIIWKEKALLRFRGMFAFALYDKNKNELFLARDRFGIKPLLYTHNSNGFYFASELKTLTALLTDLKECDPDALQQLLTLGSICQPKTIYKGIYTLMPGHYMSISKGSPSEPVCYYDFVNTAKNSSIIYRSYEEAVLITKELLKEATRYHLVADVDVGSFLSGGVDSSLVTALMQKSYKKPIHTYTLGFETENIGVHDETKSARQISDYLHTDHHEYHISDSEVIQCFDEFIAAIDQPTIDGFNTFLISKSIAKRQKVVLSGLGGDEIFAGYPHFREIYNNYQGHSPSQYDIQKQLFNYRKIPSQLKYDTDHVACKRYDDLDVIQNISACEINNYLLNTLLRDVDVVGMSHGLEIRPVLLDHKLMEFVFALPQEYKLKDSQLKSVLIDAGNSYLPTSFLKRKKLGFELPFTYWLNGPLKGRYERLLYGKNAQKIFESANIDTMRFSVQQSRFNRLDWLSFVLLSWLEYEGVEV